MSISNQRANPLWKIEIEPVMIYIFYHFNAITNALRSRTSATWTYGMTDMMPLAERGFLKFSPSFYS
jgi:hypothetical protein